MSSGVPEGPGPSTTPASTTPPKRPRIRLQEGGLIVVILVLGAFLTLFGGKVKMPKFETNSQGERQRVFRLNAAGEREPVTIERNKFLNAQNLAQLAKDTSFIAIMAVGMSIVIISGGIDLSVGAIYALASLVGALVLRHYGPGGPGSAEAGWLGMSIGAAAALGTA